MFPLENVTIAQGRDATFTCVVNNLGGYRVSGDTAPARVCTFLVSGPQNGPYIYIKNQFTRCAMRFGYAPRTTTTTTTTTTHFVGCVDMPSL